MNKLLEPIFDMPRRLQASRLGRALWAFRREFWWTVLFSMFANLLMLAPTLFMLQVFDRVLLSQSVLTLVALTLITTLLYGVMWFAEWVRSRLLVRTSVKFDGYLNSQVFRATFEANLDKSNNNPLQSFNDLTNLRQFLTGNGIFALCDAPWAPVYIGVLFYMHFILGITAIVFTAMLLAIAIYSNKLTAPVMEQADKSRMASTAYLHGKMRHAETVEAMGMLTNLRAHWSALQDTSLLHADESAHLLHQVQAFVKFVQYSQSSLILAIAALLAIQGEISVGSMVASNALMSNALRPIGLIVATWQQFSEARAGFNRLEKLLEDHPERTASHSRTSVRGEINLQSLEARAPSRQGPILKGINAKFDAGEVVAILGPSGAGKSTLAKCIVGIWPDVRGKVLLDNEDLSNWDRDELGPHLGYLPQDIELMEGTIAQNIGRFGDVNPEWVIHAAVCTGIHEMILRFPYGYDTPMGVAGGLLSGGQRQRVGLARAIYGHPSVVVLDEPNANLDEAGEQALKKVIEDLKQKGKTVFMIVHRQALLEVADKVLMLKDGSVTYFGPATSRPALENS